MATVQPLRGEDLSLQAGRTRRRRGGNPDRQSGRPLARLMPLARRAGPRPLGLLAGQVTVGPDFDDPLPADVLAAFEGKAG